MNIVAVIILVVLIVVPLLIVGAMFVWAAFRDGEEDRVIPLRGFHGFTAMQPVSYREAIEKLRHAARLLNQQESGMGA